MELPEQLLKIKSKCPTNTFFKKSKGKGLTKLIDEMRNIAFNRAIDKVEYNKYEVPINKPSIKITSYKLICIRYLVPIYYKDWFDVPNLMKDGL